MKIFFIGSVDFSFRALSALLDSTLFLQKDIQIVGIGTKSSSSFNADFCDLAPLALKHKIPYIYIENINSQETKNFIDSTNADVIYCFGWSYLIKEPLLKAYTIIGFHPSALPYNRGRHPLIWALVLGLSSSASSFFIMDSGADSGAIISQVPFAISYFDTAASLQEKIAQIAIAQILDFTSKVTQLARFHKGGGKHKVLQCKFKILMQKQTQHKIQAKIQRQIQAKSFIHKLLPLSQRHRIYNKAIYGESEGKLMA